MDDGQCLPRRGLDHLADASDRPPLIVAVGPNVKPFEQPPLLIDLAPTILAALNAPSSVEHTGRVLHEIIGADAGVSKKEPAAAIPGMSSSDDPSSVTDTEADEMEELRGSATSKAAQPTSGRRESVALATLACFATIVSG